MAAVQVKFGADTSEVDKGSAAVASKMADLQKQSDAMASQFKAAGDTMAESFNKATDSMSKLEDGFKSAIDVLKKGSIAETDLVKLLLGGAIGGAAAEIIKMVRDMGDAFEDTQKNAREATLTMEQYQNLQKAVKDEVSGDKFAEGIQKAAEKWNDLNHGASEQKRLLDLNGVAWRDQTGKVIEFSEYINKSSALIANARTEVDKFKIGEILGFSREWVRVLQEGPKALKEAEDEAANVDAEHRKLIARAHEFSEEWKKSTKDWGDSFKSMMVDLFPYIQKFINMMLGGLNNLIDIVKLLSISTPALAEAITPAEHAANRLRNSMQRVSDQFLSATTDASRFSEAFSAFSGGVPGVEAQFKKFVDENSNLPKYWQEVYNGITASGKAIEKLGEQDFFSAKGTKVPEKETFDPTAMREFAAELDKIKEKYDEQKIALQTDVDLFKKTEAEKVAALKTALAERESSTNAVLAEELMKYGDSAKQRAKIELEAQRLMHEIQIEGLKQEEAMLKTRARDWESSFSTITSAFNSQLRGLLTGTTTWAQAMKNIALDLVIKLIETFEKLAVEKILIANLASVPAPTELLGNLIKTIGAMLGQLTAGFTAFFAPTQGPAAPAEGAAAAAAVVSSAQAMTSLDVGTPYVPRTGLALIHEGEAVIPASANPFGAGAGGFISSPSLTFAISALDGASVNAWLKRGGASMIAREVASAMNNNPRLRPSY